MACLDCPPVEESEKPPQHAVSWRAWYTGGRTFEGGSQDWSKLPDDGVLAVKVFFSDGFSRQCSGNDWYGLLVLSPDEWSIIHNNNTDNLERYPNALWKRGMWTSETEMERVNRELSSGD
jgi:hypothetical protein